MRFIHLSDLHIGKRVNDFSMLEDQKYVFEQVFDIIKSKNIDGIIIAGDIYDKAVASADAVEVYDKFITTLADINKPVFIISGNHDSAQRISFASKILKNNNIYIAPVFNGKMEKVTLEDEYGYIDVYMLPFVKPVVVRKCFDVQNSQDTQNHNAQASEQQINVNNLTAGMAIFVVPILFGIYWKKATAKGAVASVIVGIISLLLFTLNPSVKALAMGFHALFPTTIIASIVMIVVSKFTETPPQETIDRHFTV